MFEDHPAALGGDPTTAGSSTAARGSGGEPAALEASASPASRPAAHQHDQPRSRTSPAPRHATKAAPSCYSPAVPSARPTPLLVELHGVFGGKDVSPDNFDVVHTMNYVSAILDLMSALAEKHKEPLSFQGMTLEPGSVAFKIVVDQPSTARRLAKRAGDLVGGCTLAPRGLQTRVARVRESILQLPPGMKALLRVGRQKVVIAPPRVDPDARTREAAELRATVFRVGGNPARLVAITDVDGTFTAGLSHELAAEIANHLYQEVDLVTTLERTDDGRIADATIHQFYPLEQPEDEAAAWRRWFEVAGYDWEDVDDIEAELDRNHENVIR
jgi:hypothetical protein